MKIARILIVDDEPLIRQTLAAVLDDEGYQTHSVKKKPGHAAAGDPRYAYALILNKTTNKTTGRGLWAGRPGAAG